MRIGLYRVSTGRGKGKRTRKKLRGVLYLSKEEFNALERPEFVYVYKRGWGKFFVEKVGEEFTRKKRVGVAHGRRVLLSSGKIFGRGSAFGMEEVDSVLEEGWDEWAPKHLTVDLPKMEKEVRGRRELDVGSLAAGRLALKGKLKKEE